MKNIKGQVSSSFLAMLFTEQRRYIEFERPDVVGRRSGEVMSQRCLQILNQFVWREGFPWFVHDQLQAVGMQDRSDHLIAQALAALPFNVPHLREQGLYKGADKQDGEHCTGVCVLRDAGRVDGLRTTVLVPLMIPAQEVFLALVDCSRRESGGETASGFGFDATPGFPRFQSKQCPFAG